MWLPLAEDRWSVLWVEETKFYQAPFDDWSNRNEVQRGDFDYAWVVEESLTIPVYQSQEPGPAVEEKAPEVPEPVEEVTSVPAAVETAPERSEKEEEAAQREKAQKKRESEEAKLQAALIEQAFRTLQEWEKVKEDLKRWQRELKLPEPVDLVPLIARLERLERRCLNLQQSQEQTKKQTEDSLVQMEQALTRLRGQLRDWEEERKTKYTLWDRVLGRR